LLGVAAQRAGLIWMGIYHSDRDRQGPRTYAPSISTGVIADFRAFWSRWQSVRQTSQIIVAVPVRNYAQRCSPPAQAPAPARRVHGAAVARVRGARVGVPAATRACARTVQYRCRGEASMPNGTISRERHRSFSRYAWYWLTGTGTGEASMPNGTISRERHRIFSRNGTGTGTVYYR
jgi:hypothetical protein